MKFPPQVAAVIRSSEDAVLRPPPIVGIGPLATILNKHLEGFRNANGVIDHIYCGQGNRWCYCKGIVGHLKKGYHCVSKTQYPACTDFCA